MPTSVKDREMRLNKNQWWKVIASPIVGFDGEGEGEGQGTVEGSQGEGQGSAEGAGEGNSAEAGAQSQDDTSGLKSALQKERADRKALEKELKAFRDAQKAKEDAEKSDIDRLTDDNSGLAAKLERLTQGYRDNAIERAVLEAATKANFRDASDALRAEVLRDLPFEQDEDDPSKITVDAAEVTRRIKALAQAKPHYVQAEAPAPRPSRTGSKFGGSTTGKQTGDDARAALIAKYPALRR